MSQATSIEWATHVWNPVTGCDRVSPGCAHCYALTYAGRLKAMGQPKYQQDGGRASGPGFGVTLHEAALEEPARWRKPRRVFVNSMSDLFHEAVPFEFLDRVFAAMLAAPQHTFMVLTKRPERMRDYLSQIEGCGRLGDQLTPNIWLGVSIENRRYVHRADVLRDTPAAVRFISAEPLLGPLVHDTDVGMYNDCSHGAACECPKRQGDPYTTCWSDSYDGPELELDGIDWLIVGGESGPDHRPCDPWWVEQLRDEAQRAGTAFFFKQWGGLTPKSGGRELDGRTWNELPRLAETVVA